ncbi:short coiled-coil protein B isoform X1 [Dicentrarchus labrax]|uniref:short coiled-coil protein B isoform X1 n=1 Tax=Dicentrarchus labrax TaxID=13489 RepID=UPI0021F5FBF8|nr:short coiled-coil protein B isoform X1 [Dicentrarchus labrax]XP_051276823.1 short coiled-coil protein B isoform X1 [Dicentrarchus labrax]XP_051276824.1 short coiled-coil protein B isoform X1 [Dicentrarchus labrax]
MSSDDGDMENQAELEEKTRLINQVLELQHTLEDLSARVDAVKEENLKLKSENQVLGQYIENLMSASSVFQTTDTKSKRNMERRPQHRCSPRLPECSPLYTFQYIQTKTPLVSY